MSYPYDYNPWDDNYANNSNNRGDQPAAGFSQAPSAGYSATDGYSNPMSQYSGPSGYQTAGQPYVYNDQQQQPQDAGQLQPDEETARQQPESGFRSFLRAHVPLCGPVLDLTSTIHIPFLDTILKYVNRDLLVSKIFYFFFYSAFGSLFPLMGVYFKQLGMNPAQVGILTGVRPFIEIFSAPFWSSLAERFQKGKALLLFSLLSWIIFTYSLAHIRPPASACIAYNDKDFVLYTPYGNDDLRLYDASLFEKNEKAEDANELYMGKPPTENDLEDKNKILASEENENDQGRKRRKRQISTIARQEQIDRPSLRSRYTYSVEAGDKDEGYESHLDLDIDLENDFDDRPIQAKHESGRSEQQAPGQVSSGGSHDGLTAFFEPADDESQEAKSAADHNWDDGDDDDEMGQSYSKSLRYRRDLAHSSSPDYTNANEDVEVANNNHEASEEANPKGATEEGSLEEQEVDQEGADGDRYNENEKGRKIFTPRHGHKAVKTNGTPKTSIMTTTTSSPEPSPDQNGNTNNRIETNENGIAVNKSRRIFKERHKTPPTHIVGMSPITIEFVNGYNKTRHSQLVAPMFSTIVYKLDDIKEVFFLLLLLISLGEFFSAPAITIADSITLGYLGDNTDLYGRQRMFGSFGWAITLMLVGMALDNSTSISDHPCGPHQRERSYTVCFAIFSLLMGCAFFTATQFRFTYPARGKNGDPTSRPSGGQAMVTSTTNSNQVITTTIDGQTTTTTADNVDDMYASTQPRNIFNTAPPVNAPPPGQQSKEKFEFLDKWKSAVFAQRTRELPEWVNVFRQFKDPLNLTYLFITWFLGCGVGLVFTFLFWHLQDVGGTPTLFGICSVINHVSEILAYFFSSAFIKRFGHTKVLSVGLGCNVIRFLYVAFLSNPYYALPFELVQGITHAACFAACCSYISHASKPELRTSTQGVMQSLHHGIGRACGTLIGGFMINSIGSRASFCIYGLLSGCVLAGFLYVRKKASMIRDEEVKVDDNEALGGYGAPQGVPSALPGKIAQTVPAQDIDYQW